jgi:hypothetical protein
MDNLTLETFLSADKDFEMNQYKILGGIKEYHTELNKKRIYPALAELINLHSMLEEIFNNKSKLDGAFPKQVVNYDFKNKKIVFEPVEKSPYNIELLFELIEWALPFIKNEIEEAIILYDFVEKNIKIGHVGIVPLYKDEGYFIVPDNKDSKLQVHRFECSIFSSKSEKYRSLKTKLVQETAYLLENSPESIKLDLIKEYKDLPNPATFICDTDLDFPFNETIFPIAKRKLMARVAS